MSDRRSILGLASLALGSAVLGGPAGAARPAAAHAQGQDLLDHILIRQVFAGYVRAVIRRDGAAVQAFFTPDAMVSNFTNRNGEKVPGAASLRATQMGDYVNRSYHPYRPGMWSHILHSGEIVEVEGAQATYSTQVTYLNAYAQAADGSALSVPDLFGQAHAGQVLVTNCGMWEARLERSKAGWKIAELAITVDLPYVAST